MRTHVKMQVAASGRARRPNVPRHILSLWCIIKNIKMGFWNFYLSIEDGINDSGRG
jgi:hypothetical protein